MWRFIVVAIGYLLSEISVPLVKKVIAGLGLGFIVFTGVDALLASALSAVQSSIGQMSASVLTVFAFLDLDKMVSLIFSAYSLWAAFRSSVLTSLVK